MRSVKLSDVQRVRFVNPVMESEFKKALDVVTQGHDTQKKAVSLNFTGTGQRTVRVGYVVENPIWKTSYRLVLDKEKAPFLQGWAVVENNTDEDWNSVGVNLVSGRPISFTMDLYQPLYVTRPHVEPELFASLRPPTYTGAIDREQWGAPGAPPPPGKPSDDKARKDSKGEGKADKDGGLGAGGGGGFGGGRGLKEREELDLSKGVSSAAQAMNLGDYFSYEIDR